MNYTSQETLNENVNVMVERYIYNMVNFFKQINYHIDDEKRKELLDRYIDCGRPFEEIKQELDEIARNILISLQSTQNVGVTSRVGGNVNSMNDLELNTKGISLNTQEIVLLSIVSAKKPTELFDIISRLKNLKYDFIRYVTAESISDFEAMKKRCFMEYQSSLLPYGDVNYSLDGSGSRIELQHRLELIKSYSNLSDEDVVRLEELITSSSSRSRREIVDSISREFGSDKCKKIVEGLYSVQPTESEGILSTSYDEFEKLSGYLDDYNLINITDAGKYGNYVRPDGTFNDDELRALFDFAKKNNKRVRINTLLFYLDTPKDLESLEVTPENKELVKNELKRYVDHISEFIGSYNRDCKNAGREGVVETVEVFNELLNGIDNGNGYKYRGDIPQETTGDFNNIRAGWFKFLDIEDICEIMANARENMPQVKFMINEWNLEDPKKANAFGQIIERIRKYEREHDVKIIDTIGTQMHIDDRVSRDSMRNMFSNLGQLGYPVEVTEYDVMIRPEYIDSHSPSDIEAYKKGKIGDLLAAVNDANRDGKVVEGVTIWSISDKLNFMIHKLNESIHERNIKHYKNGEKLEEYIKNVYGGYYDGSMDKRDFTVSTKKNSSSINTQTSDELSELSLMLDDTSYRETPEKANSDLEKPKVFQKKNTSSDTSSNNDGFTDVSSLYILVALMISTILCFIYFYLR